MSTRLWRILTYVKGKLEDDSDLATFAEELKEDEPGSAGKFTVSIGNSFVGDSVPLSLHPFVFIVVGAELGREEDSSVGIMVDRDIRFQVGFFDSNTERGTERSLALESIMTRVLDRVFGAIWIGPDAGTDGMIYNHIIGPIDSDYDLNRPKLFRTIPVLVSYADNE